MSLLSFQRHSKHSILLPFFLGEYFHEAKKLGSRSFWGLLFYHQSKTGLVNCEKHDSDKTSYSAGCWSQSDQWLKFVIDLWLYSWACFWLSSSLISIGDSLGRTPANKTYFMLLFYNHHLIINITFNHLKCKLHIKTLSSLKGVHKICIWKQFYSQGSIKLTLRLALRGFSFQIQGRGQLFKRTLNSVKSFI